MRKTRPCIYCEEVKDEGAFEGGEHVIPQAFGTFEHNKVIHCVCDECNNFFGRTIDQKLARDSAEGFARYALGLRPAVRFQSEGGRSTTKAEVTADGPWKGALVYPVAPSDGGRIEYHLFPQVGFAPSRDGDFLSFMLDSLPTRTELLERWFKDGVPSVVRILGAPVEEVLARLKAKGYTINAEALASAEILGSPGEIRLDQVFTITDPEFRVLTKIALNYVASVYGQDVAALPQFDEARRFVRHGVRPKGRLVSIEAEGAAFKQHWLAVEQVGDRVIAHVSLYGRFIYQIQLSDVPFTGVSPIDRSGHVFDVPSRLILPV